MHTSRSVLAKTLGAALAGGMIAMAYAPAVYAQADKAFVMKLGVATINDTQHEWLRRFVAAVEKESNGRIKGEIYPASQLGPIPRMIEGVQFGSIQAWIGPPEFLVGVDVRYEALSAPGLMNDFDQMVKVLYNPEVQKTMFGLGEAKGLEGIGFAPIGPSSIITKKEVKRLADLKGMKLRVLASPLQLEQVRRMGSTPGAMTRGDEGPALKQTGRLEYGMTITLPPDLQKIVRDEGTKVSKDVIPFVKEFFAKQYDIWKSRGGVLNKLPPDEHKAKLEKVTSNGEDLSKDKPDLNKVVKMVFEVAKRK